MGLVQLQSLFHHRISRVGFSSYSENTGLLSIANQLIAAATVSACSTNRWRTCWTITELPRNCRARISTKTSNANSSLATDPKSALICRPASVCGARRRVASRKVAEPSTCPGPTVRLAAEAAGAGTEAASLVTSRAWNPLTAIGAPGKSKSFFAILITNRYDFRLIVLFGSDGRWERVPALAAEVSNARRGIATIRRHPTAGNSVSANELNTS